MERDEHNSAPSVVNKPADLPLQARSAAWLTPSRIVLASILLIAAALRFWGLNREGYWGDEYVQTQLFQLPLHYTIWYGLTQHGFGPPDFLIGWLASFVHSSEWMCRLPAAVWGIVAVATCYALVARIWSREAGLAAAALLTLSRMHLVLSQEARPNSICLAFIFLSLLAFVCAWERPTLRRLLLFGGTAFVCAVTRSFIPSMYMASIGLVLTVALLFRAFAPRTDAPSGAQRTARTIQRLWLTTATVGLLVLPMLLFLYQRSPYTPGAKPAVPNAYEASANVFSRAVAHFSVAAGAVYADFGPIVLVCMAVGVWAMMRRRPSQTTAPVDEQSAVGAGRYVCAVLLLVGPVVIGTYAVVGGVHAFYPRYSFFLLPTACAFAGIGLVSVCSVVARDNRAKAPPIAFVSVTVVVLASIAWPAAEAYGETQSYRRHDWRGCAALLTERTGPNDVIMVISSVPFGRVQQRFYGKYEWPIKDRPLAEAAWTLAISDNHFERLLASSGDAVAVIAYPIEPQPRNAYLHAGLQAAPAGYRLEKFRGLDVLMPTSPPPTITGKIDALCRDLTALNWQHESTPAVLWALRSRLATYQGDLVPAAAWYARAASAVPERQRAYFDRSTESWRPDDPLLAVTIGGARDR